jgi:hypothetical protein
MSDALTMFGFGIPGNYYANCSRSSHSYSGLALLYRVTGHPEESLKVLERLFILMPKTSGIESTQIYTEARNLYSEIKSETESKTSTH